MTKSLPPVAISRRDHASLERLAAHALSERHPVSRFLMSEIQRAVVCDDNKLPQGVVGLNQWVTYRLDDDEQTESKILVCPDEFRSDQLNLSVLSPLGAAILGLKVGDRIGFFGLDCGLHVVVVESVAPAAAPTLFPLKARGVGNQAATMRRDPDDEGPPAA
jgi:regulator of nucleoside diphosphate kinase